MRTPERRIPDEHRLFFWEGELVAHAAYHPVSDPLADVSPFRVIGSLGRWESTTCPPMPAYWDSAWNGTSPVPSPWYHATS